jgi:hypothetical protein
MPASNSPTCSKSPASTAWLREVIAAISAGTSNLPSISNEPDGIFPPGRFVFGRSSALRSTGAGPAPKASQTRDAADVTLRLRVPKRSYEPSVAATRAP